MQCATSCKRFCFKIFLFKNGTACNIVNNSATRTLTVMPKCSIISKVEKRFLHFQAYPLHQQYKPRLSETFLPSPTWTIFYRQNDAFEFAKDKDFAKVFSVELPSEEKIGPRSYVVSSIEEFWSYYTQLATGKRHFYEVIPSNANCHMYFDLEFDRTVNPFLDGEKLIERWIDFVIFCLNHELGVPSGRNHVIELDSTTDTKFSQHLIWHIPNTVFKNNLEVGNFVHSICDSLRSYLNLKNDEMQNHWIHSFKHADKLGSLDVNTSSGNKTLFVDEGVYTKNRNFRLYLSNKKGKVTELKLSSKCIFDFCPIDLSKSCCCYHVSAPKIAKLCFEKEKLLFFSSLITNVHKHKNMKVLEFASNDIYEKKAASVIHTGNKPFTKLDQNQKQLADCVSHECFTKLLEFVTNYVQNFNENAYVSKVSFDSNSSTLFYDISGTRYCDTVGREHKSNGIFIVVNLEKKRCFHRCYDHNCRKSDSKPPPIILSKSIVETLTILNEYFANEYVSDLELLKAAEDMEST